jgi:hypothetical protein
MGSSVEGLKLRRMRIQNEISFNRSREERTEWVEDLEALREELLSVAESAHVSRTPIRSCDATTLRAGRRATISDGLRMKP